VQLDEIAAGRRATRQIRHAARRSGLPAVQHLNGPIGPLVRVTERTGVRNIQCLRRGASDEAERMGMSLHVLECFLANGR
jgi:hypothetical protein